MPFGYEYNDNTYDRDGFQFDKSRHFETAKEASEERKKMTIERCTELRSDYGSELMCVDYDTRKQIMEIISEEDDYGYDTCLDFDSMPDDVKEEVLKLLAPHVYEIVVIDVSEDSSKLEYKDGYGKMTYNVKINESEEVVMHSLEGPAYTRRWDYYPEDNKEGDEYYIEGKKVDKDEWMIKRRDYQIDKVVED